MATHDPILALMRNKRLVIKNGGISKIIETTTKERANLETLQQLDAKLLQFRQMLRNGETIEKINDLEVGL